MDAVTSLIAMSSSSLSFLLSARYIRRAQSSAGLGSRKANRDCLFRLRFHTRHPWRYPYPFLILLKSIMARYCVLDCGRGVVIALGAADTYLRLASSARLEQRNLWQR